jgi:hypothetical protein
MRTRWMSALLGSVWDTRLRRQRCRRTSAGDAAAARSQATRRASPMRHGEFRRTAARGAPSAPRLSQLREKAAEEPRSSVNTGRRGGVRGATRLPHVSQAFGQSARGTLGIPASPRRVPILRPAPPTLPTMSVPRWVPRVFTVRAWRARARPWRRTLDSVGSACPPPAAQIFGLGLALTAPSARRIHVPIMAPIMTCPATGVIGRGAPVSDSRVPPGLSHSFPLPSPFSFPSGPCRGMAD